MCSWKSKPKIANKGSDPDANVFWLRFPSVVVFFLFVLFFVAVVIGLNELLTLKNKEISQHHFCLILKILDQATPSSHSYTATSSISTRHVLLGSPGTPEGHRGSSDNTALLAHFHPFLAAVEVGVCKPSFMFSPYPPGHMGQ